MRRVPLLPVLLLAATACAAPTPPEVTFYADGEAVAVAPLDDCDIDAENCRRDPAAEGRLRVRPGLPVQISVPGEVADTAWGVNFRYRDAAGVEQEPGRSAVFTVSAPKHAYTLTLPNPGDRLIGVEVQQLSRRIQTSTTGAFDFVARRVWVLTVEG
ncbi:DUF2771 family protein [Saccharothrix syringae]|uniref:DUF2771 family protein n=1 Tax=Saccharothrix syringae TaxID=103733 RepID=A0A5Q0GQZ4_SACSY|nr:DUF2771 family protein [Saccharothrix syringae]QFZ16487.1 DUF2771 family protein [Saccharothrix syringae]